METKVLVVCTGAGFLGLLSTVLGLAAEGRRIRATQVSQAVNSPDACIYPTTPAFGLGLAAALALLVAQIIINTASGCISSCKRYALSADARWHWALAMLCLVVSWVSFASAFVLLLSATTLNDQHYMENKYLNYYCYVVKPGVFAGAATLSFISVTLGLIYYLALTSNKNGTVDALVVPNDSQADGLVVGRPQVPPKTQDPVFVDQDTYFRRQFTSS